jgi:hypothetical protein
MQVCKAYLIFISHTHTAQYLRKFCTTIGSIKGRGASCSIMLASSFQSFSPYGLLSREKEKKQVQETTEIKPVPKQSSSQPTGQQSKTPQTSQWETK